MYFLAMFDSFCGLPKCPIFGKVRRVVELLSRSKLSYYWTDPLKSVWFVLKKTISETSLHGPDITYCGYTGGVIN